jgi:uncharacterized protein (DUF1330 family)
MMSVIPKSIHSRIAIIIGCISLTFSLSLLGDSHLSSAQNPLITPSNQGRNSMSDKSIMIVIAVLNPAETETFNDYSAKVLPLFKEAGGVPVNRYKRTQDVISDDNPTIVAIMEFPNDDAVHTVFRSEAYQQLLPLRDRAFQKLNVFIAR